MRGPGVRGGPPDVEVGEVFLVLAEHAEMSSRELRRRGITERALRYLVKRGVLVREVRRSWETKSLAGREFGGVVTMRRRRAYYRMA